MWAHLYSSTDMLIRPFESLIIVVRDALSPGVIRRALCPCSSRVSADGWAGVLLVYTAFVTSGHSRLLCVAFIIGCSECPSSDALFSWSRGQDLCAWRGYFIILKICEIR